MSQISVCSFFRRVGLALLLLGCLAPACSPQEKPPSANTGTIKNLVLLTDSARWEGNTLSVLRDSLRETGNRVIVSGYPGEGTGSLLERLPWLLQPGVDVLLCDPGFLTPAAVDSLRIYLDRTGHPAEIRTLIRE